MYGCTGKEGGPACRVPALRAAILGAFCTATEHLTAPRHLGPLLYLSLLAEIIMLGVLFTCLLHHQQHVHNPVVARGLRCLLLVRWSMCCADRVCNTMETPCLAALQTTHPTRRPSLFCRSWRVYNSWPLPGSAFLQRTCLHARWQRRCLALSACLCFPIRCVCDI